MDHQRQVSIHYLPLLYCYHRLIQVLERHFELVEMVLGVVAVAAVNNDAVCAACC